MAKNKAPSKDVQQRNLALKLVKFSVGDDGTIEGYGSVFGVTDSYGTIVDKGAFTKTLQENTPKMLWQHDWTQPIGVWTAATEDNYGLKLTGQLCLDSRQGADAYALLKQGAIDGLSIGFFPVRVEYDDDDVVHFQEVGLMEVSVVTFPANTDSTVLNVKSIRDMFHDLTDEQRKKVVALINTFNQSPPTEAPVVEEVATPSNDHPEVRDADKETNNAPQSDELYLHSLDAIDKTLERLLKTTRK